MQIGADTSGKQCRQEHPFSTRPDIFTYTHMVHLVCMTQPVLLRWYNPITASLSSLNAKRNADKRANNDCHRVWPWLHCFIRGKCCVQEMWNEKESLLSPSLFKLSDKNSSAPSLSPFLFLSLTLSLCATHALTSYGCFPALFFSKEDDDFVLTD